MQTQHLCDTYRNKKILVTGHTGFKGSWLCHMLLGFGAQVAGVGLPPRTERDIFVCTDLRARVDHHEFDIRDDERVRRFVQAVCPDIVFHLAAQPLVRHSYDEPLLTMSTNVMGTANVLEAIRQTPSVSAAVIITTDKVYENKEIRYAYQEADPLGGYDPYSGSKAAADIVTQSYIRSFFNPEHYGARHSTLIAIARAGNVIGGGDFSPDRIIPDIVRAVQGWGCLSLRNPEAIRPWQHVLDPLHGYLLLGARLAQGEKALSGAWNFGPDEDAWVSVYDMTRRMNELFGNGLEAVALGKGWVHEAGLLMLDSSKAKRELGWYPRLDYQRSLAVTAQWYMHGNPAGITEQQIASFFNERGQS